MGKLKSIFTVLILAGLTAQPLQAQSTATNGDAKTATAENIKERIPQDVNGWQLALFEYHPRGFYDEPLGAAIHFSKAGVPYIFRVEVAYDIPEEKYRDIIEERKEFEQELKSDKIMSIKKEDRIIYKPINSSKVAVIEFNIRDEALYLVRKKHSGGIYTIKSQAMFGNRVGIRLRTCEGYDSNDACEVKNGKKATDAIISILKAFDFKSLASLAPIPYSPPKIDVPKGFKAKYFKTTNTVVGFAYPEGWTFKRPYEEEDDYSHYFLVSQKDFAVKDYQLYKSLAARMRLKDKQFRLFAPDNVLIWFDGMGDRGDRWNQKEITINMEWFGHKLNNVKVVQKATVFNGVNYPAGFFVLSGEGVKGQAVTYKEIQFQEPSGRVFKVSILRPEEVPAKTQENIEALLQSIIALHSDG